MNVVRRALCKHCNKECKTNRQIYCSKECYTNSGHRAANGRVNGKVWVDNFWDRFADEFEKKYGHLPKRDQIRKLIQIGQKRTYFKKFKERQNAKSKDL